MPSESQVELCVAGLVYFEVFVPPVTMPAPGQEVFVDAIRLGLGGALNTASVATALGLDVVLAYPRGEGLSDDAIAQRIARLGISTKHWLARTDPAISLVFSGPEDRAFVSAADFDALQHCESLCPAKWIHVPGLLEAKYLSKPLAIARAGGARISVSGSWAPAELAALQHHSSPLWDLLILNDKEAACAAGDPRKAPELLRGAASSIVVTAGAEGAFGLLGGKWVSCPAEPVTAIDFTGAGDAFCAGFLAAHLYGMDGADALRHGCRVAARLLTQSGGVVENPELLANLEMNN
ncbi:MAG: carbohydrate kinase family protein [Pseudomonadota bacterium]